MTSRAERRRADKAEQKAAQYKRTKFIDRATYQPFAPSERTGSLHNGAYTAEELHQRAVERRDRKRMIEKFGLEQIEASKVADKERRAEKKAAARDAYLAGCAKPQPVKYMNSAARCRLGASDTPRPMTGFPLAA